ncbi:hypothetical protein AVEN_213101-1 [Araneus ventricosus]|uniref:Uncharacterized protein n=1 Tax=Araneus ventricosus TaxID=182803 RepID=A0A4Y2HNF1_ARAVE|nr:hypothetical protein AVEN_213101-1 [Araneus ventricosus]
MGHITLESRSSLDISYIIYRYITTASLDDFSNLFVLRCDGTAVNTGVFNGVICRLELKLQRAMQWIICLHDFNELPLYLPTIAPVAIIPRVHRRQVFWSLVSPRRHWTKPENMREASTCCF